MRSTIHGMGDKQRKLNAEATADRALLPHRTALIELALAREAALDGDAVMAAAELEIGRREEKARNRIAAIEAELAAKSKELRQCARDEMAARYEEWRAKYAAAREYFGVKALRAAEQPPPPRQPRRRKSKEIRSGAFREATAPSIAGLVPTQRKPD